MSLVQRQIFSNKTAVNLNNTSVIASYNLNSNGIDAKNSYNGTVGSSVIFSSGAVFDGTTNSYISIPDNNDFSFTDNTNDKPFSICGYLKVSSAGYIVSKAVNAYNNGGEWALQMYAGIIYFRLQDKTSGAILMLGFNSPFNNTAYKHFALTYSGSKTFSSYKFYIDGVLKPLTNHSSHSSGTYTGCKNTSQVIYLGGASDGSNKFAGSLKDLNFFNKELTSTEVTFLQTHNYPF